MPRSTIERIREKLRLREYDMSAHAMEEMAEDELDVIDVETALATGESPEARKMILAERSMSWRGWLPISKDR
jgi:hypothetical protein